METAASDNGRDPVARYPQRYAAAPSASAFRPEVGMLTRRPPLDEERAQQLARGLGWFSVGIGLASLLMPNVLARSAGVQGDHALLMRAIGVRELVCGAGILGNELPAGWLWSRVGGDALDLGLLALAAASPRNDRGRIAVTGLAVAGVTAFDVLVAEQHSMLERRGNTGLLKVEKVVTVNRPPEEVYLFWRNFENLPRFMAHVESVQVTGARRSHWRARGSGGRIIEWDSELTIDQPGQMLAWRSVEGSDIAHSGSVRFEPADGGRGTKVHVEMFYNPPAGFFGALIARLFGQDPGEQIESDLRRFKQLLETGEISPLDEQSSASRRLIVRLFRRRAVA